MSEVIITGKILSFNQLDRQGEIIYSDCAIDFPESVPMVHEWGEEASSWLGFANLEKKEDGVWAKMHIRIEDQSLIPAVKKLKPCIGGTVYEKENVEIFGSEGEIRRRAYLNILKKITINRIGICMTNVDYGIQTLEEMENDTGTKGKDQKVDE